MVDIKIEGNRVKLDNYKLKNIWLVPEWEIITTEDTRPILDVNGVPILNDSGEPIILSSFQKVSRVLLKPEEKEMKFNAKRNGREAEETSEEKGIKGQKSR